MEDEDDPLAPESVLSTDSSFPNCGCCVGHKQVMNSKCAGLGPSFNARKRNRTENNRKSHTDKDERCFLTLVSCTGVCVLVGTRARPRWGSNRFATLSLQSKEGENHRPLEHPLGPPPPAVTCSAQQAGWVGITPWQGAAISLQRQSCVMDGMLEK